MWHEPKSVNHESSCHHNATNLCRYHFACFMKQWHGNMWIALSLSINKWLNCVLSDWNEARCFWGVFPLNYSLCDLRPTRLWCWFECDHLFSPWHPSPEHLLMLSLDDVFLIEKLSQMISSVIGVPKFDSFFTYSCLSFVPITWIVFTYSFELTANKHESLCDINFRINIHCVNVCDKVPEKSKLASISKSVTI